MDAVKAFNSELSSLMDTRPPISKAKMTAITRAAIKAIKFYKHVVQCVEKFIQKCKPEYKVPGLYVVDSIVRQSRHQFTPEKDVFAPRFARNIQNTFMHLFNCPPDDKGKVVRVLNLWQKNQVFTPDVIQPLLDMASRVGTDQPLQPTNGVQLKGTPSQQPRTPSSKPSPVKDPAWLSGNMDISASSNITSTPVKPPSNSGAIDPNIMQQLQNLQNLLLEKQSDSSQMKKDEVKFDKKLLDFDYDEDDEEQPSMQQTQTQSQPPLPSIDSLQTILSNPEVLRHLQTLQQQMSSRKTEPSHEEMEEAMKLRRLQEMRHQEEEFDKHLAQTLPNLPFATECDFKPSGMENSESMSLPAPVAPPQQVSSSLPGAFSSSSSSHPFANLQDQDLPSLDYDERNRHQEPSSNRGTGRVDVEVIDLLKNDSPPRKSPRRESRRRRRSRSRGRHSRSRSRSRRRARSSSEDRETERRRKKGLPPIKKNHLAVCSTTLWIGHLSKLVQEEELSDTFGHYGEIVSINLIPPRGCAFVCMNRRQDADKALKTLKHAKLHGKAITIAWAPGKAMKEKEWKDYWEVETGTSYIPWSKLSKDTDFSLLEEGGMLDEETFPDWLKDPSFRRKGETKDGEEFSAPPPQPQSTNSGGDQAKKDNQVKKMPQELDIPMPTNNIPGFIPLPETTMAPPPATHGQTPSMPPPPMGLIPPPFALPPQRLPGLIGPMGHMGPMMGNVPLGVPPPIMMPPPPQGMVPRMPAPPFNPGPVGMMPLGPDKSKPPQMPGMPPDGFPDHLAQMFGLPIGHGMPPGVNMQQQQQSQNQMKGGPSEMDIDELESKDMNTNMDITHGPPPMGGFNQPPPNFNQSPLLPLPPGGPPNQKDGQGTPRSGDRKSDKEDSRRGRDRDKDRRDGDSRGRGDDRDSSKRRRRGDSSDRDRGRGNDRDRNRRGGNDRNDRNDRNRRDWGKGSRNGSKWSDRDKDDDRDRKDKKSSSGGEGKEDRPSGGEEMGSGGSVERDRESRKAPLLPSPGSEPPQVPPPLQFPPGQGPPGPRPPPGLPPGGFGPRFGGPMDGDNMMMDGPPPMGGDFPPPMGSDFPPPMGGDYPPPMGDFPPPMGGDFPPPMGGDFPPPMGGDFPPPMGGDYPPQMGGDFMSRGDYSNPPRDFQQRGGDFGPRGFFRGPMRPPMGAPPGPPQQGNRALLRTPNGPMFGPPRGPGGPGGPMGIRGSGPRGMGGPPGRMDGPPHGGYMNRGSFPRMDWRGGPPPRFGGGPGPNRWEEGPSRWEDGPPRWEEGPNRWEEGPPPPGPGRWEERRWSEVEIPERPERPERPRRSRWSSGPPVPQEETMMVDEENPFPQATNEPSLERIPEEQQKSQLDETIPPGVSFDDHPPENNKDRGPTSSNETSVATQPDHPVTFEESIRPQNSNEPPKENIESSLEKSHIGDGENVELSSKQAFECTEQNRADNSTATQESFFQEPMEPQRDEHVPIESSIEPPRRDSFEGSRDTPRRDSFEGSRDPSRRDSFEASRDPPRRDSFEASRDPPRRDSFEGVEELPRRDSIEASREALKDLFEDSREPPRRNSFEDSSEPPRTDSFEDSREPPRRDSFEGSREPPKRESFEDSREPPCTEPFNVPIEPPRTDMFEDSRDPPRRGSFESKQFKELTVEETLQQFEDGAFPSRESYEAEVPQVEHSHPIEESSNDQRPPVEDGTCSEPQAEETAQ